jgi:hypothetical protein
LTQSNQSYTHVSAFIVAHTTGYRICLQSFNTDKPRDKLKTGTAKILGKRRIRSLQSVGGHNPKKKERWLQYSQLRKEREKPEKVLYSGTFQSYRPIKEMGTNQGPGTAVVNVALTHLLFLYMCIPIG